ncbi:MAG: hypothetical protein REI12_01690 [Pedobacter sp.]|nr:hypothetical protein [Pedobacter sp.]
MNKLLMTLALAFSLTALPAWAEDKTTAPETAQGDNTKILADKLKADKKLYTAAALDLTDAEAKAFWPLYGEYQAGLDKLNTRLTKLVGEYTDALGNVALTDKEALRLNNAALVLDEDEIKLRKAFAPRLAKALPGIKATRYLQIENKVRLTLKAQLAAQLPLAE